MLRNTRATALLYFVSVLGARTAAAQDVCLAVPAERTSARPSFLAPDEDDAVISFRRLEAGTATGAEVSGDIRVAYGDRRLIGERALVTPERIDITGRVAYEGPEANIYGEDAVLDRLDQSVFFGEAGFEIPSRPARGSGEDIFVSGTERRLSLSSFFFTTCPEGDRSCFDDVDILDALDGHQAKFQRG